MQGPSRKVEQEDSVGIRVRHRPNTISGLRTDGISRGRVDCGHAEERRVLLDQRERIRAAVALAVLGDPAELEPPGRERPSQRVRVGLGELSHF